MMAAGTELLSGTMPDLRVIVAAMVAAGTELSGTMPDLRVIVGRP